VSQVLSESLIGTRTRWALVAGFEILLDFQETHAARIQFRATLAPSAAGRRYRRYFDDPRTAAEQKAKLGRSLASPKLLLLIIGRNSWQNEWLDLRQDHPNTEHSDMRIVSYDDICNLAQSRLQTLKSITSHANQLR